MFWIKLNWGKLTGRITRIEQLGPYPTYMCAKNAMINFNKLYGTSGASATIT